MKRKIAIYGISCMALLACAYGSLRHGWEVDERTREATILIRKIDSYRKANGKAPVSAAAIGIDEKENSYYHYERLDSDRYMIWCGASLGESYTWYSDTRQWVGH